MRDIDIIEIMAYGIWGALVDLWVSLLGWQISLNQNDCGNLWIQLASTLTFLMGWASSRESLTAW